ncbi:unnamed protein product [Allacma fusca]|uniref:Uncharacterized protein n=1 Tax=Allacma fusca TaxID=39272 RepID=A0A8J2P458_9HEXA|nr:unnamed protein product [Allacma fusca]
MKFIILLLICMLPEQAPGQVCSPPGQLCARSTDCCRGCCEQYTCVERSFLCSPDQISQPGSANCHNHQCPQNHICYLREVCPPENPCPRLPYCRRISFTRNNTYYYGNGSPSASSVILIWPLIVFIQLCRSFTLHYFLLK